MLTSIPPRTLHWVRDAAAVVHDLAQLGLELLCPCEGQHSDRLGELSTPPAVPFQPHKFANGVECWCGAEHWRIVREPLELDAPQVDRVVGL